MKARMSYIHSTQIYQCNVPFVIIDRRSALSTWISLKKTGLSTRYVVFFAFDTCMMKEFCYIYNICHIFLKSHEKYLKIVKCQKT